MFETYVTLVGRVATEMQQRTVASGDKLCTFRMATNERRFNKETQEWVNGDSLYIQVTCWRRLAENVSLSLFKGDPLVVQGRMYTRSYELDGERRSVIEVEAKAIGPDLSWCSAMVQRPARDAAVSDDALTPGAIAA